MAMRFRCWSALWGWVWLAPQPAQTVEETVMAQIAFTPGDDPARTIVQVRHRGVGTSR
jgi:hypothetical protein